MFDTCSLVDVGDPQWADPWTAGGVGPHLRLILGFNSQATVSRGSTLRGASFVKRLLNNDPIAAAWLDTVHASGGHRLDYGVALAFGDTDQDVDDVLDQKTIQDLPLASAGKTSHGYRRCH